MSSVSFTLRTKDQEIHSWIKLCVWSPLRWWSTPVFWPTSQWWRQPDGSPLDESSLHTRKTLFHIIRTFRAVNQRVVRIKRVWRHADKRWMCLCGTSDVEAVGLLFEDHHTVLYMLMYWTNSATSRYRKSRDSNSRLLSRGRSGMREWRTGSGVMRAVRGGADRPTELMPLRYDTDG